MTTSKATRAAAVGQGRANKERLTFVGDFIPYLAEELEALSRIKFPTLKYRSDPVGFFNDILGVEPWSKQVEILEAIRDYPRVAVKSGHKVSKSHSIAGAALWCYCSFEDARVVLTSTTSRQVDQILWRELRMMKARGGRCLACKLQDPEKKTIPTPCPHSALIPEEAGELARTGMKSKDFREIVGFTAREAEAVAGISGKNLWYFPDEASGIGEAIFEAIEGNRAGGARVAMFGNPTKNEGTFYDAFNSKSHLYKGITVSSEETPNVVQGREVIPGLATRDWIEEKKIEWGEASALYKVRVKGEFAEHEEGRIFSVHAIGEAELRWQDTVEIGRLFVGIDPAGASGTGDESAMTARRGLKMLQARTWLGLSDEAHLVHLLAMLNAHKIPREIPVVVVDREGQVGARLYGFLKAYQEANPTHFELVAVAASNKAFRQPHIYDRVRDELVANLEQWLRDGGAILANVKLAAEMHAFEWKTQSGSGKLKATDKITLKKILGRSPDRFDSLALAVWEPLSLHEADLPASAKTQTQERYDMPQGMDPYAGAAAWGRR